MEIKVVCGCGQKYKFDVEPVNGQMPFTVTCPACGVEGTGMANGILAQRATAGPTAVRIVLPGHPQAAGTAATVTLPTPAAPPAAIRVTLPASSAANPPRTPAAPAPVVPPPAPAPPAPPAAILAVPPPAPPPVAVAVTPPPTAPPVAAAPRVAMAVLPGAPAPRPQGSFSLPLGIVGALVGAAVGIGIMFGFYQWVGFRFRWLGVGIGLLTGLGARILARGTDTSLGAISAAIATLGVVGTLFLMYGEFPFFSIISVLVSAYFAFRVAA